MALQVVTFSSTSDYYSEVHSFWCVLVSVGCPTNGEVRLLEGNSPLEGRVEVCKDSNWNGICDAGWNDADARIICRQLGFSDVGMCLSVVIH